MQRQSYSLQNFQALFAILLIKRNESSAVKILLEHLKQFIKTKNGDTKTIGDRLIAIKFIFANKISPQVVINIADDFKSGASSLQELLTEDVRKLLLSTLENFTFKFNTKRFGKVGDLQRHMAKVKETHYRLEDAKEAADVTIQKRFPDYDLAIACFQRVREIYENDFVYLSAKDHEDYTPFLTQLLGLYIKQAHMCYVNKEFNLEKLNSVLYSMLEENTNFKWDELAINYYENMISIINKMAELKITENLNEKDELYRNIGFSNLKIFYDLMRHSELYNAEIRGMYVIKALDAFVSIPKERRTEFDKNIQFFALYKVYEIYAVDRLSSDNLEKRNLKFARSISALLFTMISETPYCEKFRWNIEMLRVLWLRREAQDHYKSLHELSFLKKEYFERDLNAAKEILKEIEPYHTETDKMLLEDLRQEELNLPNRSFYFI